MSAAVYGWYGYSQGDRTFHYAIAASFVLHALLLFAVPGLKEGRNIPETPGVLVAHIVELPRAPVAAPPPPEPVVRPPVEPPKPRVEAPPKPPPPLRTPSPIAEPAPARAQQAVPEPTPAAPPATVASVPAPATAPAAQVQAYQGSLRDYEQQLSSAAARYKFYPRVAIDNAWEGDVEVEIDIAANGILRAVKVKTSSGHKVLDQQAIEMFRRAKPLVPIPPALAGKEFTVTRWVSFGLKEGG